jgi:SOS-response transcriptional repressor LexA
VVMGSRLEVVHYKQSFDGYIQRKGYLIKTLVAFSGTVQDDKVADITYTEEGMNRGIREGEARPLDGPTEVGSGLVRTQPVPLSHLIENLFVERMDQNDEIFVRFMNDLPFQKVVTAWMASEAYTRFRDDAAGESTAAAPRDGVTETRPTVQIVQPRPEERYVTCVPLVPLKAAAGAFSDPQYVEDDNWEWVAVDAKHRLRPGMFVVQVVGKSMEPTIPNGSYCLFRAPVTGTRQGRIVLVQLRDTIDPDNGERYTVKRYLSEKVADGDSWRHARITLKPINPDFQPIELTGSEEGELQVVAEFVEVLAGAS